MPEQAIIALKEAAGNDKKIADDKKATNGAESGSARVKRLDGATTIDEKVFLECEILSYAAVSRIGFQIAQEVKSVAQDSLIIFLDDALLSAFHLFQALQLQISLFVKGFSGVSPAGAAPPSKGPKLAALGPLSLAAVTGAVDGVLDLLGLFRQDTQFFGRTVTIKETALYLELASFLRTEVKATILYPRLMTYQASEDVQRSQAVLGPLFDGVFKARRDAADRLRPLLQQVAGVEKEILDREVEFTSADEARKIVLTGEIQDLKQRLVDARKNLDPDLVLFENTDSQWNELLKGLNVPDAKSNLVPLQLVQRAAEVLARFQLAQGEAEKPNAFFFYAEAVVAGGSNRIRKSLWRSLWFGDGLDFSGGVVVSYALIDGKARVVASRTHRFLTPFQEFETKLADVTGFNSV